MHEALRTLYGSKCYNFYIFIAMYETSIETCLTDAIAFQQRRPWDMSGCMYLMT